MEKLILRKRPRRRQSPLPSLAHGTPKIRLEKGRHMWHLRPWDCKPGRCPKWQSCLEFSRDRSNKHLAAPEVSQLSPLPPSWHLWAKTIRSFSDSLHHQLAELGLWLGIQNPLLRRYDDARDAWKRISAFSGRATAECSKPTELCEARGWEGRRKHVNNQFKKIHQYHSISFLGSRSSSPSAVSIHVCSGSLINWLHGSNPTVAGWTHAAAWPKHFDRKSTEHYEQQELAQNFGRLGFLSWVLDVSRCSRFTAVARGKHQCRQLPGTLAAA